ncbi:glypican-1b, partial [Tachysurus ichikawai]
MDVRLVLVLCVLAGAVSPDSASGKSRSCAAFRQFYSTKGFAMLGVPMAQIS